MLLLLPLVNLFMGIIMLHCSLYWHWLWQLTLTIARIAQLVEHQTHKPGTTQTQVWPRDFTPSQLSQCSPVNFQCRLSYSVHTDPMRNCNMYASTHVHMLKLQTFAAIPLFGLRKILHPLVGMDTAAFVTAVVLPGKVTKIFHYPSKATQIFHI